jgi:DNA-binding LacI/PurR family transcriptional regulator
MPHAPHPTLRSLAAEAGVSPMTVSLALRNSHEVSAATRRRLQRLAAVRGYRPDPVFNKLMHHLRKRRPTRPKTNLCGIGHRFQPNQFARGNYLVRLEVGLRQRAQELGFAYDQLMIDDFVSPDHLQRVLISRGVEGLVILPLRRSADLSDLLDWSRFAVICATPAVLAPRFHGVMPNHFDNMLVLCDALRSTGYRRIGLAIPADWNRRVRFRWAGGIAWQNLFGGTTPITPFFSEPPGPNLDPDGFAAWLRRERPDAVITDSTNPSSIEPGLAQLPAHRRPSIITMNWPDPAADAGIDQRASLLGSVAIEVLAGMLTRGEKGVPATPTNTMVEGVWMKGKLAVRPAAGKAG